MTDHKKMSAAIHEASHAVVSHTTGCVIKEIEIHETPTRWEGSFRHDLNDKPDILAMADFPRRSASVAIAGVLGQSLYNASVDRGCDLRFSRDIDFQTWLAFLTNKKRTDEEPGEFFITFETISDSKRTTHRVDGQFFGAADTVGFNHRGIDMPTCPPASTIILSVIDSLETSDRWNGVKSLANALCNVSPDEADGRLRIRRDAILDLIAF